MTAKAHSRAVKLSATFLAKLAGVDTAASLFGIDRRTVRGWLGSVDVPEDHWSAIEETLLARGAEMTARGDTRGLVQTLTGAGIASRNRRYQQLIAQREARRQGEVEVEQPDPVDARRQAAIDALSDERQRYVAEAINLTLWQRTLDGDDSADAAPGDPEAGQEALTAWVEGLAAMPEDEFRREREALTTASEDIHRRWEAHARAQAEAAAAPRQVATAPEATEPSPPSQDVSQPSKPSLRVVDDGPEWLWTPYARWRIE